MQITTNTGFIVNIDDDFNNDFEILSLVRDLDRAEKDGDDNELSLIILDFGKKILGKDFNKMITHLKSISETGKVTAEAGYTEITDIIKQAMESKKKSQS